MMRRYPRGAEILPTWLSKGAMKKQIIYRVQLIMITYNAGVTIHKKFFLCSISLVFRRL
jgi:hypothetical protein